jgi:hypothetical protein
MLSVTQLGSAGPAARANESSYVGPLDAETVKGLRTLYKQLIESENRQRASLGLLHMVPISGIS